MRRLLLILSVVLSASFSVASARTWYITSDGMGDAPTIQAGVDSAGAGDTVLVACGTYYDCTHSTPDGHLASVIMKSGVTLLSESGEADCATIDAQGLGRCFDCVGVDADALVKGFTITGGFISGGSGGGMRCDDAPLGLANLVFTLNQANNGGGLGVAGSSAPVVEDCVFSENTATSGGGGVDASGYGGGPLSFLRCDFSGNQASSGGGAVDCTQREVDFDDCTLTDNNGGGSGGAVRLYHTGSCHFIGCVFAANHATYGSAIYADGDVAAFALNCTFYRNAGGDAVLVYDNMAYDYAGFAVVSSIIAYTQGGIALSTMSSANVEPQCCNWYGNSGGDWVWIWDWYLGQYGNFSACPSFCSAATGDFHLCDQSPCLPGNHPDSVDYCGLIGALGEGCSCGPSRTETTTWGGIKSMYR
jgi:predicted outer membrane repeat protein